jgi:MFS family permease
MFRDDGGVSRRRPLILLEGANLIAGMSNSLVMILIPWLILERTGSAAAAGLAGALTALPGILMAPLVGVLVDRLGRKTVSVGSDILSAASVALFPIADLLGRLDLAVILALTFLGAALDPAGYTARKSLLPDVARASQASLTHVNGLHEGLFMAGYVIGPVLGAAAIATVGVVAAMWLAFAAFLLAAGAVSLIAVPNRAERSIEAPAGGTTIWREALVGLRVLVQDHPLWTLSLAVAVLSMIYMPTEAVLLPVHFEALNEPESFGLILSMLAAGAMLGSFGYGWIQARFTKHQLAAICMVTACLAYVPMATLPALPLFMATGFILGLAWGPMEPLINTLVQERFPAEQHGRVYGIQLALYYAAPPLGNLVVGVAVGAFGVQPVFAATAAALVITARIVALMPSLRGLNEPRNVPTS